MSIEVIPSMDFWEGKATRLRRGNFEEKEFFNRDPVAHAKQWEDVGATLYHRVNVNGGKEGGWNEKNGAIISGVTNQLTIPVQIGGGIRDRETVERLLKTRDQITLVVGSILFLNPEKVTQWIEEWGPEVFMGDFGFFEDKIVIKGWQEGVNASIHEAVSRLKALRLNRVIVTDKSRDGVGEGPNLKLVERVADEGIEVVISGGVATEKHLKEIAAFKDHPQIVGVILGRRLYETDGAQFFKKAFHILQT